jgi:hypothetical protein
VTTVARWTYHSQNRFNFHATTCIDSFWELSFHRYQHSQETKCRWTDITQTAHLTKLQQVQVTCRIVNRDGLMLLLCGGLSIPNCHRSGASIPASRSRSLQSFTSAEMFPRAHRDCSLTASSLLLATRPIKRGRAPDIDSGIDWEIVDIKLMSF